MEDTRYLQTEALKAISSQLLGDFENAPLESKMRCVLIPEWWILKSSEEIIFNGHWGDYLPPKHPQWVTFDFDRDEKFLMSAPSSYIYEIIGLIYEVWKARKESENPLQDLLSESLQNLRKRWAYMGDPLSIENQMRLIGEVIPLVEAISIVGNSALDAWDADGRALYDIEAENWIIEAKATRSQPERVWLSHPKQVDWRSQKPIILAVTRMNKSVDGSTFPQIINEHLSSLSPDIQSQLRLRLLTVGLSPELDDRYTTKWAVNDTRYIEITQDSQVLDCEIFDGKPDEVIEIKYQLETENMTSIDLRDILGD